VQDLLTMASDVAIPSLFAGGVAITATVLVERLGGSVGGIISTVPTTIVPAAIGIWWRRTNPDDFINAMAFVPIGTLMNAAYLVLWRVVPARVGRHVQGRSHMLAATLTVALGAWLAVAAVVMLLQRSFQPTPMHALAVGGLACLAGLVLGVFANRASHPAPRGRHPVRVSVLALRGVAAALAIGFALVIRIVGIGRHRPLPPDRLLIAGHLAGVVVARCGAVLQFDAGVPDDVEVPDRVLRRPAQRGDHRVLAVVLNPHQGRFAQLAGFGADRGQQDDRHALQFDTSGSTGLHVQLGVLAGPIRGAGFVFSGKRHTGSLRSPRE
jgi:hypothetical protein